MTRAAPPVEEWFPSLDAAVAARLDTFRRDRVVERIRDRDLSVWGEPADIGDWLGWLTAPETMRAEAERLQDFAETVWADGFTTAVLLGMGGSSLAPEVMQSLLGSTPRACELLVLDTTDPDQIMAVEGQLDLDRTLFIVSSKSGSTIETLSGLAYFWEKRPQGRHFIAITDAGSRLHRIGEERQFRGVFLNPPDVGGRYSALTYFGLVPAALIGADLRAGLAAAAQYAAGSLAAGAGARPVIDGVRMGEAALAGRDKVTILAPPRQRALGWWLEQLLAESTGKNGTGLLPVEGEPDVAAGSYGGDRLFVSLDEGPPPPPGHPVIRDLPQELFTAFWHWEMATAAAAIPLGVNPFDQPSVQEAKDATNRILEGKQADATTPPLAEVCDAIRPGDFLALLAYLPRNHSNEARLARVRRRLLAHYRVATTAGFGPRYLHSTGQYHKDGPNRGVFIQVVDSGRRNDLAIPGAAYTFGELQAAQALGDLESLRSRGRRIARTTVDELETFAAAL